jgi:hypothetical protein
MYVSGDHPYCHRGDVLQLGRIRDSEQTQNQAMNNIYLKGHYEIFLLWILKFHQLSL